MRLYRVYRADGTFFRLRAESEACALKEGGRGSKSRGMPAIHAVELHDTKAAPDCAQGVISTHCHSRRFFKGSGQRLLQWRATRQHETVTGRITIVAETYWG